MKKHKSRAPRSVTLGILSVSTTRSLEDDKSGLWMKRRAQRRGHDVLFHEIVSDDQGMISGALRRLMETHQPDAILVTGGTGIGASDVTIEALRPLFAKELTAFGPLFTFLSYEEIDAAALLSRATAGLIGHTLVFCLPGSLKACKLACKELIFPELGHLVKHAQEA
jgi:molybdenum cofactor biosynthesis protein B